MNNGMDIIIASNLLAAIVNVFLNSILEECGLVTVVMVTVQSIFLALRVPPLV